MLVPRAPAHLELRHLLLQVKDELLHPRVIGLIVVEFFLLLGIEMGHGASLRTSHPHPTSTPLAEEVLLPLWLLTHPP